MLKQVIVIAGVARSGTSWLGQIIDSSPQVIYRFQPLFSYAFKDRVNEDSGKEEYADFFEEVYRSSDDFLLQTDKRKANLYPVFQKEDSPGRLAFKENSNLYLLPKMLEHFEELKLIGIIRHPCGALNSWLKNPREFPPDADPRQEWRFGACKNLGKPQNFFGFYKWKEVTHLFLDLRDKLPGQVHLVRYEELVNDPLGITRSMFDFLGLEFTQQTELFLKDSQSIHLDNPYAVFKDRSVQEKWRTELDPYIQSEVLNDLKGTRLEAFLK
jgi:hypothetical protein